MEEVVISSSDEDELEELVGKGQGADSKTELQEISRELAQVSCRSCNLCASPEILFLQSATCCRNQSEQDMYSQIQTIIDYHSHHVVGHRL